MFDSEIAAKRLIALSIEMSQQGLPLMQRILPSVVPAEIWSHYPPDDAVSPISGARYFYHCHPPEQRGAGEHGHFHLFLPLSLFRRKAACSVPPKDGSKRAEVVHFAALSVDCSGVPVKLFTVNRWVTDEWLFPAQEIMEQIDAFDLNGADGDDLVNDWLTVFVMLARNEIGNLLTQRDLALAVKGWPGEDRAIEIMSMADVDLQSMLERAFTH